MSDATITAIFATIAATYPMPLLTAVLLGLGSALALLTLLLTLVAIKRLK